jgi:plasmid maintenance system antidote protein VapI
MALPATKQPNKLFNQLIEMAGLKTDTDLAKLLGIDRSAIGHTRSGNTNVSHAMALKILQAFPEITFTQFCQMAGIEGKF